MAKKKRKKKTNREKLMDKLDKQWSLKVRAVKRCALCGMAGELKDFDAHHIQRRGKLITRWDLGNGACLCSGRCHIFGVHMDTLKASILLDRLKSVRGDDWYDALVLKSNITIKMSIDELETLLDILSDKELK